MKLTLLTNMEFNDYVGKLNDATFYQSEEYARFMQENNFDYDLVGIKDSLNNVRAAALILFNNIDNKYKFGYAPRGFLIDYNDKSLVKDFAIALSKFYKNNNVAFIKINPNIIISKYNKRSNEFVNNENIKFITYLKNNKFQDLKRNKYFESILPTYAPIINLKKFAFRNLDKNVRNKISKCYRKGLMIEKGQFGAISDLYPFIKNKTKKSLTYYQNLYRQFDKTNKIDVFLVKVNFEEYLINTKAKYQIAQERNNILSKIIIYDQSEKSLNRKMQSDKELLTLKNDIVIATNGLSKNKTQIIGGAIVIKFRNKVIIYTSGYDKKYKELNVNDFLYYKLIEYYKYNYDFLDLDGFSGDLSDNNPYKGLNNFKLGFKPDIYEYIGEFDIIFKKRLYNKISSDGTLSKLFNKFKQ